MSKKRSNKGSQTRKQKRATAKRQSRSQRSGPSGPQEGSGGGGALMSLRGGFKGAVGTVTGKKPKTRKGAIISNIFWTLLTVAALALLAYKLWKVL